MVYKWKEGSCISIDAEKAYKELSSIKNPTPKKVEKYARTCKKSELHQGFEWDIKKAAYAHRLDQARRIIQSIIQMPDETKEDQAIRCFENVIIKEERVFVPTEIVFKNEELYLQVLDSIKQSIRILDNKLKTYERQYKKLRPISERVSEIRQTVEQLT